MLCHDWGPAKNLKWCPLKESFPDPKTLGYLAGIFADGNVHIIKVELPTEFDSTSSDSDGTDFLYIPSAAYTIHLPLDIITALSWISHTSLVVGCATGHIAAWDLDADITAPYLYMPLHQTYISGLNSCWPSFPNHIVTSSMDGYSRLTSLLAPISDSIPNNRSRIAPCAMTYIDTIQAGVSIEEGTWVKFFPLRRYFSSTTVCKHGGIVRALSASVLHPFLLTGGTEGEAMFSNPLRRVFHGKIKNFQQTWFQLEYSNETNMLRMTEGFKLEECEGKAKVKGGQQLLTTVFPEQVGIGALGWNPNVRFGGWAAAAASCGLVRVEDVAIDP